MLRSLARWLCAAFFVVAGAAHFAKPALYLSMIPRWVPVPTVANYLSGALEIAGGIALLFPASRRVAGWLLLLVLFGVWPVHIQAVIDGHMGELDFSPTILWLRIPFQGVLIAWVWWVALARAPAR